MGRLDLVIEEGNIERAKARNIPVNASIPKEPKVYQLLSGYRQRFVRAATQVVGESSVRLIGSGPS